MRSLAGRAALALVLLACAGSRPLPERAAATALPEPDPACRAVVADAMRLRGIERVTVRVALVKERARVDLLAPELTPAQADDVRRAFADCAWRPGEGGTTIGTVEFTRPR